MWLTIKNESGEYLKEHIRNIQTGTTPLRQAAKRKPDRTQPKKGFIKQAVRTSGAAALALYLAQALHLPEAYWAAISAIIVMQSDLGAVVTASISRLAGTAIGAIVGACAVSLLGVRLWSFALAVLCAILLCAVIGRWETYRFAGVTVAIVMLVTNHGTPWTMALHRFLEVSFGIVVAVAITFAWP